MRVCLFAGALSGDPFGAPLPHDWFQPAVATMPATAYLLPVGSVVGGARVSTRGNNYTADDVSMLQLLRDAGLNTVADLFPSVSKLRYDGTPVTSVAVTCVIGVKVPTPLSLHYDIPSFTPGRAAPPPVVGMGDGDGTVNRWLNVSVHYNPKPLIFLQRQRRRVRAVAWSQRVISRQSGAHASHRRQHAPAA